MHAQRKISPTIEVGACANAIVYQGDLSDQLLGNLKDMRPAIGIFGRGYINPNVSLRVNFYRGSLTGDDTQLPEYWRPKRAYKFTSPLTEFSLMVEVDLLGRGKFRSYIADAPHTRRWSIYFFGGIGMAFVDAKRDWSGLDRVYFGKDAVANIPQDSANDPDKNVVVFPAGLGVRYDVSKSVSVFAEGAYRFTFTDNLDGYKYSVYSPRTDGYTTYTLGVSLRFNSKRVYHIPMRGSKSILDRDMDGVVDTLDKCPDSLGYKYLDGCPDRDLDSVADCYDDCPLDSGLIALHGCPDRDKDGIADKDDQCPDSAGTVLANGCPDRDADGIADRYDQCPDVPGLAKYYGCPPPDTDKDGYNDDVDLCPTLYCTTNDGCPAISQEIIKAVNIAAKNIFFETAKDILKPVSIKNLNKIVTILKGDTTLLADIEGHTDSQGDDAMNMDLSNRRAKVVYYFLLSKGISPNRLTYKGFGETTPAATNDTPEGRALNRRTEIKLRNH